MSLLISNATVVIDPLEGLFSRDHAVVVDGTRIAALGWVDELAQRYPDAERLDGTGKLLLPGLIDAHTHLYAALTPGMPYREESPRNFPQILERVWWPFDKALREDDLIVSAQIGSIASIRNGITTIVDHHSSPMVVPNSLSRLAAGVDSVGLRACLAYEVSDRDGPDTCNAGIYENSRFAVETKRRSDHLVKSLFGLHAVFSMSDATLCRCADVAKALGVGCHLHMAEHIAEVQRFAENHDLSIAEFLAEIGILGPQTVVAHTVHVNRADIEVLKDKGTFNVHNPKSNMGNGVGIAPVRKMLDLGQPVGLGSDGFYDMPQEMTIARLLQTLAADDPGVFSDELALKLVYDHNARYVERIFGRRFGSIKPGYEADLILLAYNPPTPIENWNIRGHVVAALNGGCVRTVLVGGKVIMRDGDILGLDEAETLARAQTQAARLWARL